MSQVRAVAVKLQDILNATPADSSYTTYVIPVKATRLRFNTGFLIQDKAGDYFIATQGEWFRNGDHALYQVDALDQLKAIGLTDVERDLLKEVLDGQKISSESGPISEETGETVEANPKRKKKS
jgi:hypothetical protein